MPDSKKSNKVRIGFLASVSLSMALQRKRERTQKPQEKGDVALWRKEKAPTDRGDVLRNTKTTHEDMVQREKAQRIKTPRRQGHRDAAS